MRNPFIIIAATLLLPLGGGREGAASAQTLTVSVTNPSSTARRDVPVVIDLHKTLGKKAFAVRSAEVTVADARPAEVTSASSSHEAAVSDASPSGYLPSQLDDLDGDLVPDELCFVADIPARSTLTFHVQCSATASQSPSSPSSPSPRTDAFMKVWDRKYRYPRINSIEYTGDNPPLATYDAIYGHGAQWESELVGFRVYMDHRQSIDIYGKPTPQLVLDKTNFYSTCEDMANGLGCDILFAGASVGAGSFRGYINEQPTYIDSVAARGQRIIASGPVRAIVEVTDKDWFYAGHTLQMRQRYTIYAGHRDVEVDIALVGIPESPGTSASFGKSGTSAPSVPLLFCTGVQKLEQQNKGFVAPALPSFTGVVGGGPFGGESALAASFGLNVPDKAAEDLVEGVGLGVCVPAPYLTSTKEDDLNYLTILHPVDGHIRYHLAICALMEQATRWDAESWFSWLRTWQAELNQPCKVVVKRK